MEVSLQSLATLLTLSGHRVSLLTTPGIVRQDMMQVFENAWLIRGARPGKYSMRWWLGSFRHSQAHLWKPDIVVSISSAGSAFLLGNSSLTHVAQCHGTALAEVKSSLRTGGLREYAKVALNCARIVREVLAYKAFREVWAVSDEVSKQLLNFPYTVSKSRLVVISNGVDVDRFKFDLNARASLRRQLGIDEGVSVGITLSRLHSQKGVDKAILSLAQPGSSHHVLIVTGDGGELVSLERLARDAGVSDRVHFVGHLDTVSVSTYLSAADILVFPTMRVEGLPLSLLEALASGLSVVTSRGCNVPVDLQKCVSIVDTTPAAVAKGWQQAVSESAGSPAERLSLLPGRFGAAHMAEMYLDGVVRVIRHSV